MEMEIITADLIAVLTRNTVEGITTKIKALKKGRNNERTIQELEEIINDLINDRSELARIAQVYKEELVAQQIKSSDIEYITEELLPILKKLMTKTGNKHTNQSEEFQNIIDILTPLLSVETFTILQLLGFNFKRAIGEPLTDLLRNLIMSKALGTPETPST